MVYLLKFGASWILPPGIFIVAFFGVAIYAWKCRHDPKLAIIIATLTFALYLLCTGFVAEKILGSLESEYTPPIDIENRGGDVIILLGGGALPDVPDVDGNGVLCSSPANRLLTAVRLQRKLNVPILLSGGQVFSDTGAEAKIASKVLKSLGVEDKDIIMETKSINTTQNAKFSAEILQQKNLHRPIIVTSAFHMKRAVLNFEQQGIEVIPYPTDYMVTHSPVFHYTKLRPQSEALLFNVMFMQETLRTFVTKIFEI
ncbi:MAG: YdcF family protein [Selenomonadaceae bacterium]|nr:YdcF family protein [Selenomonadaceae bacterium]